MPQRHRKTSAAHLQQKKNDVLYPGIKGQPCAYLKISQSGETCITEIPEYLHITAAYCLSEHRGKGVFQNLLNYAVDLLKKEGYAYLGVDYESLNPTAYASGRNIFQRIPTVLSVVLMNIFCRYQSVSKLFM